VAGEMVDGQLVDRLRGAVATAASNDSA